MDFCRLGLNIAMLLSLVLYYDLDFEDIIHISFLTGNNQDLIWLPIKNVYTDMLSLREFHNINITQCLYRCQSGYVPGCRSVFYNSSNCHCLLTGNSRYTGDVIMDYNNQSHGLDYWEIYRGGILLIFVSLSSLKESHVTIAYWKEEVIQFCVIRYADTCFLVQGPATNHYWPVRLWK